MVRKTLNIESITPEDDQEAEKSLTSDLPFRGKSRKIKSGGGFKGKVVPLGIILLSGIVGFMIPALQNASTNKAPKSITYGQEQYDQDHETDTTQTPQQVVSEPVYEDVEYATVKSNEVGFLNIRASADRTSERLGQANIGDKFEVIKEQGEWINIKLPAAMSGQTEGWVAAEYVTVTTEKVKAD